MHQGIIGELRMDPFVNLDNCALDDEPLAIAELLAFTRRGRASRVVDPTCRGIGRNPRGPASGSRGRPGCNIVMGSGYYLQSSHPPALAGMSIDAIADEIVAEALDGIDGVRIGLIGEIGVSVGFHAPTRRSRCAGRLAPRRAPGCR